jgi:hypothetical protein
MKSKSNNRQAKVTPVRLKRLKALNARLRGQFKDFMTQDELRKMREDNKYSAIGAK